MSLETTASLILVVMALVVLVFQISLACGAPWGALAFGGQNKGRLPQRFRIASALSVALYAFQVLFYLAQSQRNWNPFDSAVTTWIAWIFVAFFALGTVMNGISRSKPERFLWTPVVAVSLLCAIVVAIGVG